jgi:hypothetical protein
LIGGPAFIDLWLPVPRIAIHELDAAGHLVECCPRLGQALPPPGLAVFAMPNVLAQQTPSA